MPSEPATNSSTPDTNPAASRGERRTRQSRTASRTVFDARQRLTSTTGTRASYDRELLREYADSRKSSLLAVSLLLVLMGIFASFWVPRVAAIAWAGLVISSNLMIVFICNRFLAEKNATVNVQRWTKRFIAGETTYGVTWATLALLTLTTDNTELAVVIFAILLMGTGANAMASRALPMATLMTTLPATITVSISLITLSRPLYFALAAVAIVAQIFILLFLQRLQQIELDSLANRSDRDTLILDLEDAREYSDQARREAEQANIAKSNFLATMSHELRTPLNAIIGFSEVLKSELLGPHQVPQYKEYATDIHSSGQHLLNLINELLDLSRIEAGKYDLNEEVVSLRDVADDCLRMMKIRAKTKKVELVENIDSDLPKIWGDERAIRQIMLNLLTNAIKFTPQEGRVELVVARSSDGGQIISVRDNGPGIPEDEIATVLSSFGQGSLAHKTAEDGAGLGLAIVQKIMDLHQGRFDLFSKLRFGTEAIATFPRARIMDALAPVDQRQTGLKIY